MKYRIIIKRCEDSRRAQTIAEEVSRWSGNAVSVVLSALVQKPVCIKKEAEEAEAMKLKLRFESVGAEIELVRLDVVAPDSKKIATDDEEDDDDAPGRLLSDSERVEIFKRRPDIFYVERDVKMRYIQTVCISLGLILGLIMSTVKFVDVRSDFLEKMPEERIAKLVVKDISAEDIKQKKEEEKKKEQVPEEKQETKKIQSKAEQAKRGMGGQTGGGGDPRARVTQKGVLGIISGKIKGKSVASADLFGQGGFATDIDAVLHGVGGLKSGGGGGVGRKGAAGIGYGVGYGSGFGGGSGGVDDLIGSLAGGGGGSLNLKPRAGKSLDITPSDFIRGAALTGGRSKSSIMRVVLQNIAALRYAYNKRLRDNPGLKGKVKVKFAIDEFGKVIFCEVLESTMGDADFDEEVKSKIKRWVFEKIDKPGDVTEVVYPFVFQQ